MDGFDVSGIPPIEHNTEPIPFEDAGGEKESANPGVSHTPLDLGQGSKVELPQVEASAEPAKPTVRAGAAGRVVSAERITGVKTFFTKLHPGAIDFLDSQISGWLNENPGVVIKRTNVVVGEVQAKKTEPNVVVLVWY